jgi:L-Ala-D/L-Glu epimerase
VKLVVRRHTLRLRQPLETSYGMVGERELLAVSLTDNDGVTGYGEAAMLEPYDGVSIARVQQALERYRPIVEGATDMNGAQIVDACRRVDDLPEAFAAIDLALWDRAGRRSGRPVASLVTDTPSSAVPVNATLSALDRAGAAEQAAEAVEQGFRCLKVKVGVGDDAARVAAVRAAAGSHAVLRIDANGAWDVEQAVRNIEALSPAGLELVEEPVHGLAAVREVRERVAVRVAIDETAAEHGALTAGVADAVCLKISRCGGISGLLAAAALVRASGAEVYVASTLDGPLGIAAGVHAAAALASRGPLPACGLATLGLFEGLPRRQTPPHQLTSVGGRIPVPDGPGLGVEPLTTTSRR